jgi:hypothetical protein
METRRFAVDDVISISAQVIATMEMLKGTFDDEIKRIMALRQKLADESEVQATLKEAKRMLADAKRSTEAALRGQEEALAQQKEADAKFADVARAQGKVDADAAKLAADRAAFDAKVFSQAEVNARVNRELDDRAVNLNAGLTKLRADQQQLSRDKADLNRRLDQLKAPA